MEELARQLYLRPREIEEHGRKGLRPGTVTGTVERTPMPPGERELARILLDCSSEWRRRILETVDIEYIRDPRVRQLMEEAATIAGMERDGNDFLVDLLRECTDPDTSSLVAELCTAAMPDVTDESIRIQMRTILQRQAREGARRLEPLIAAAEARGDHAELDRLLAEKRRLRLEMAEI